MMDIDDGHEKIRVRKIKELKYIRRKNVRIWNCDVTKIITLFNSSMVEQHKASFY
jgi:hypothetical protein